MNFIAIVALLLYWQSGLNAQTVDWTAPGNNWTYGAINTETVYPPHQLVVDGDTIINGLSAKIFLQKDDNPYATYEFAYTDPPTVDSFIAYQSGDSLMYYVDSGFHVLYDFSLEIGDTMLMYAPIAFRDFRLEDQKFDAFRVDSTTTLSIDGKTLRGQYLRRIPPHHFIEGAFIQGWRYELLGTVDGYLFPYGGFQCDGACPYYLRCFTGTGGDGDLTVKRVSYPCDTVLLRTATNELDLGSYFSVYPNPVSVARNVTIEWSLLDGTTKMRFTLYDPVGRQVSKQIVDGSQSGVLPLIIEPYLPVGIYTLTVETSIGRAIKRLVLLGG